MRIRLSARYQWEDSTSAPFFDQTFTGPRITIGNSPTASLSLNGSVRSGEQIVIVFDETDAQLINLAEGTALNGETLELNLSRPLNHGDLVAIGTYRITIAFADDSSNSEQLVPAVIEEHPKPPKSFAAILDSLRTDEDRFYFVVEGSGERIPIELEQMPLGWDASGAQLCFDISSIADLCAVVRKDWSGVILRAQIGSAITVNGEPLEDERRLRDGDRVFLNRIAGDRQFVLIFHEPTSLVILDTVMPRVAPEANTLPAVESSAASRVEHSRPMQKLTALIRSDKEYFVVFTFVELSLMAVGTIVGAVIIFLILNFS
ncbi:MAG TPA: FHA domain-containing protein [Pyrinomonadaceae bacterium]|nr:FHA domain-containing protein [Pyrinomonadaceae bacterium]